MGAFYAAFAYTGLCDDSGGLCSYGSVKGMLLRHLRWWARNSEDIFSVDGTLNIGYLYPNMYVSENYNSPQSSYWAVKSLIVVALQDDDPFWTVHTVAHPSTQTTNGKDVWPIKPAKQVVSRHSKGSHHFMISSGQFCVWSMKATEAKYAKFAYSSAFGFSVPTGSSLSQIAPDSTLALSRDRGETWSVRWKTVGETDFVKVPIYSRNSPDKTAMALVSRWRPWSCEGVEVETTLVAPNHCWPDWHVRVHRIRFEKGFAAQPIIAVEGGFAINGERSSDGRMIKTQAVANGDKFSHLDSPELALEFSAGSLVLSSVGASGVLCLPKVPGTGGMATGEILIPDPNTNLVSQRTLIPTIKRYMNFPGGSSTILATGVFAVSSAARALSPQAILQRWNQQPKFTMVGDGQWELS